MFVIAHRCLWLLALFLPFDHAVASGGHSMQAEMKMVSAHVVEQPMIFVRKTGSMNEIPTLMSAAFEELGDFLASAGVVPVGPPMAVYHDWSGGTTAVDVGFPVSLEGAWKARGDIHAGMSPGGYAIKTVHVGPYDDFPATYTAIGAAMKAAHVPDSTLMWEVYVGEPGKTPDADLITEIYMKVSAEDAAKFPSE